ncbi:RNA-directed DNA polymerase, eukaryota, reverse transcriptase zinc-binding domain protein [Tanacetum coccineum]
MEMATHVVTRRSQSGSDTQDAIMCTGLCVERKLSVNTFKSCLLLLMRQLTDDELKLLHQKAKINWLKEGDKNSAYFHSILRTKKNKSRVEKICKENRSRVDGEKVLEKFVNHFQSFLGKSQLVQTLSNMNEFVQAKLSKEEALAMIAMVTDEDIKATLLDIDSSKPAGLDRYTSCFFKRAWSCIGNNICLAIKEFFQNGKVPGEINGTLIALVPKIDTPNKVSDFRLIACCNVLYKCISKILTNIIKDGLSKVVSLNQSAFIPGRHIEDNILISQELLKGYNRKNGAKRYAMKIDIQKASDIVIWDFQKNSLLLVGFHEVMVNWIMTCISTTSFSICINGEVCGFFKGRRGLRQGDPISPYLFTIVMEVFNMIMIKNIVVAPSFKYHYGCKDLKLTHMCFAVDLMVICNSDKEYLKVVKKSLEEFICVSKLDKLFKRFLWNSGKSAKGKARVAWKLVCRPKEQGESVWEVESCCNDSWGWKQLLEIRDKIKPYVSYNISDGKGVFIWYDNLCKLGTLANIIPKKARNKAKMKDKDSVADLVHNRLKDTTWWIYECNKEVKYSVSIAWRSLRDKWLVVNWRHVNERNRRIFKDEARSVEELVKDIQKHMTDMLMSLNVKSFGALVMVAKTWGLVLEKGKLVPLI